MMTLISSTAKRQMHFMDAGPRFLANFGILVGLGQLYARLRGFALESFL